MTESIPADAATVEVDATITDLQHGFGALPLSKAVARLDAWHRTLAASDRDDLNTIADGLGELKACLLGPVLDGDAIGERLARLGAQTVSASGQAESEATGRAVERLGNLLLHAGHALRGPRADAD